MILILLFYWIDMRRTDRHFKSSSGFQPWNGSLLIKASWKARIEIAALYPTAWEAVKAECS